MYGLSKFKDGMMVPPITKESEHFIFRVESGVTCVFSGLSLNSLYADRYV